MALNNSKRKMLEWRRGLVAERLRAGWSQREIAAQLGVSLGTINNDVQRITDRWRERAGVEIGEHRAAQLAETSAIKQKLWKSGAVGGSKEHLRLLLQAIRLEAQITGTIAAPSFTVNVNVLAPIIRAIEASGLPPEEAGAAFEAYFKQYAVQRQQEEAQLENGC